MGKYKDIDFSLRLSSELKEKLQVSAQKYNRTATADVVARLEQSFDCNESTVSTVVYSSTYVRFKIRLPAELKKKIKILAKQNARTMSDEIVARLERTFAHNHDAQTALNMCADTDLVERFKLVAQANNHNADQLLRDYMLDYIGKHCYE